MDVPFRFDFDFRFGALVTNRGEWVLQFDTTGKPALDQAKIPPARDFA